MRLPIIIVASLLTAVLTLTILTWPDNHVTLEGQVVAVCPVWTKNGDGVIFVQMPNFEIVTVKITGYPSNLPETEFKMKVKHVKDLIIHKVRVTGVRVKNGVRARLIQEL